MSLHTCQLSTKARRLQWRNQRREYQKSIALDAKPRSARRPRGSLNRIRLWDPVASLPMELALVCLQEALPSGKDYPAALIELTSVCSKWQELIFSAPRLWTKIHVRYSSHDLMATMSLFVYISAGAPLDLIVWNALGSEWEDVRSLLLPHTHRIKSLTLGDDPPIYLDSPYTGAAYISLASSIFYSLSCLPGVVDLDFGRSIHVDPSQLKTLTMSSEIRILNTIKISLHNIADSNNLLVVLCGREVHKYGSGLLPGLVCISDQSSGKKVIYSKDCYLYPTDSTILSLNFVISFLVDILGLLNVSDTSNRVSSSSSYMTFVDIALNVCHLCSTLKGSLLRAVGCVRSHFGVRPFRCPGCRTCNDERGYARFCTFYLLLNHVGRKTCNICGTQQTERWRQDTTGDLICSVCCSKTGIPTLPLFIRGRLVTPPTRENTPTTAHTPPESRRSPFHSMTRSSSKEMESSDESEEEDDQEEDSDTDMISGSDDSDSLTPAPSPPVVANLLPSNSSSELLLSSSEPTLGTNNNTLMKVETPHVPM